MLLGSYFTATAHASTWYVDQSAVGDSHGTSLANAWTSMSAIIQSSLTAGDVVEVYPGTYDERFAISKGGTNANTRITYKGVGLPVIWGIHDQYDLGGINYIAIIGFEITQPSTANCYPAINLAGDNGWLIQDNYIHDTYSSGVNTSNGSVNSNNIIRHNTFANIGSVDGGYSGGSNPTVMNLIGNSNLVEYNSVVHSMDRTHAFGAGNVIRNNYWGETDTPLYPNATQYPSHTDGFQSWNTGISWNGVIGCPLVQLLYERNYDTDNTDSVGGTNAHGFLVQDSVGTNGFNWAILRFNVLIRPGGAAYSFQNVSHTYVYNSTYIAIQNGSSSEWQCAATYTYPSTYSSATSGIADVRNTTWDYCPNCLSGTGIIGYLPVNFTSAAQHSYNVGSTVKLPAGASPANLPQVDPLFTRPSTDDYTLQAGSPLIAEGAPLTTAIGAGSDSISLNVADSKRLFDGWGIADADFIKVGMGPYVQISSINYNTDVVTLASAISWKNGDPVIVKGTEDVGALPFSYATPFSVTNTTLHWVPAGASTLSATVTNPDAVRKVEFLIDGIPVGESNTEPYSINWTADGILHSIEARAYSAWASKVLSISSFNSSVFETQPHSQTAAPGSTVILTASAVAPKGSSLIPAYQWQLNGVNLTDGGAISGSSTATLTITNISAANNGNYTVVASDPSYGSYTSSVATITTVLKTAPPST